MRAGTFVCPSFPINAHMIPTAAFDAKDMDCDNTMIARATGTGTELACDILICHVFTWLRAISLLDDLNLRYDMHY